MGGISRLSGRYDRGDGVEMERGLIVGVGIVCGSFVMFTAAMCCSRPGFQHSLRDVGLRRERIGALGDRRVAGCFRQEPAMTQRRARQQGARELPVIWVVFPYVSDISDDISILTDDSNFPTANAHFLFLRKLSNEGFCEIFLDFIETFPKV